MSNTHNCLTTFCTGLPGWADTRRNIHPLTHILITRHPLSTSSIYYDPQHLPYSICVLDSPLPQPLSRSSLVYLLVWNPLLHTPCISSTNHHLVCAAHAHAITACSAVIPMLCHLYLISVLAPYLEILMPHIHLTTLISAH